MTKARDLARLSTAGNFPIVLTAAAAANVTVPNSGTIAAQSDFLGQQTIWVPAGAMVPNETNGAAVGVIETATHDVMVPVLFFDASTQEAAQFMIQMPKSWDEGTLVAQFLWGHGATTTNFGVAWDIAAVAFGDSDAMDAAFGTAVQVTDVGGTTDDLFISAETGPITVAGTPGAEDLVCFRVRRVPSDAGDTMAIDARLIGVKIHYTISAGKDD